MQILSYSPGQKVTIFLEVVDATGVRTHSSTLPLVDRIIYPSLTLASSYPHALTSIDTGLYYYQFTLPTGATAVGTYWVEVSFTNPINNVININSYQIVVSAPYGNFGTTSA